MSIIMVGSHCICVWMICTLVSSQVFICIQIQVQVSFKVVGICICGPCWRKSVINQKICNRRVICLVIFIINIICSGFVIFLWTIILSASRRFSNKVIYRSKNVLSIRSSWSMNRWLCKQIVQNLLVFSNDSTS